MINAERAPAGDDAYAALAPIYDEWQERHGAFWRLVLPRLGPLLDRQSGGDSFLDLGCGTGSLLLALRARHPAWRLCGMDRSRAMLDAARRKPGAETIDWQRASFDTLTDETPPDRAAARFLAAGAFFDTLNHAHDAAGLDRAFAAVAGRLSAGGIFVFDLNNRRGFGAWWNGRRVYQGAGWTLTMDAHFDAALATARGTATVQTIDADAGARAVTAVTEHCFADQRVAAGLEAAGFAVEAAEAWTPMGDGVPGKTWWVARKR